MEGYCQQGVEKCKGIEHGSPREKSVVSAEIASDGPNGCFDCNICLDNAHDPVVTLCGHLYCWPCIYKWLYFQGSSMAPEDEHQCPVCKADISQTTLVPLYGRGQSSLKESKEADSFKDLTIPSRPSACGVHAMFTSPTSASRPSQYFHGYPPRSQSPPNQHYRNGFATSPSVFPTALHPMIGMFGEMVYARVFGNSPSASLYWYPNAYQMRSTSPRIRRQEMQAEKSLNRISVFLFCCFVLCLLLF